MPFKNQKNCNHFVRFSNDNLHVHLCHSKTGPFGIWTIFNHFIIWITTVLHWGQSYKDFDSVGQIYKHVLNHENNPITKSFSWLNVRTQCPNILEGLYFYSGWNGNLGTLFYASLRCKKFYRIGKWHVCCTENHSASTKSRQKAVVFKVELMKQ